MKVKSAKFLTSVANPSAFPDYGAPEIALCGKSNVGKSSFINFVTGQKRLAKVGKVPGMTRLVNYFSINEGELVFVDLPGYGFANVSAAEKRKWGNLIEGYLQKSHRLKNVFLLIDIRRDPGEDDILMINYLYHYAISFTVIVTKTDKLSKMACKERIAAIASALMLTPASVIAVSAEKRTGLDGIERRLSEIADAAKLGSEDDDEE